MNRKKKNIFVFVLVFFTTIMMVGLTSCSSGPSNSEISTALYNKIHTVIQQQIATIKATTTGLTDKQMRESGIFLPDSNFTITKLKSNNMTKIKNGDYTCNITFSIKNSVGIKKNNARITLTKVDGHWNIINLKDI